MVQTRESSDALQKPVPFSRPPVEVFVGNAAFHRCFCGMLDSARSEILDYVVPEQQPDEYDQEILAAYARALKRRIRCRTLITAADLVLVQGTWTPTFDLRKFLDRFDHIRLVDRVRGPFTVIDCERVLLNLESALQPGHYGTSVVLHDSALASRLAEQFSHMWEETAVHQEELIDRFERRIA
ncbi:MAG TPA: hypothetical protein VJX23_13290 [Candidatus Binataceae bacterium]|nr:hypothetical protein [Candidatus Binataceae bacterium]